MARASLLLVVLATLFLGLAYPLGITGVAHLVFPERSGGSLIRRDGVPIGSAFVGQSFSSPGYFWGRPSATPGRPYDAASSAASNLGPLSPELSAKVKERAIKLGQADPAGPGPIPADLLTASGSGLDPHISVQAAEYQVERVAQERGLEPEKVRELVRMNTEEPELGFLGEARVNVLRLNIALDELTVSRTAGPGAREPGGLEPGGG